MAFWAPRLVTALVTTHIPLERVPRRSRRRPVARATYWLAWLLARVWASARRASPSPRSTRTPARPACSVARSGRASRPGSRSRGGGSRPAACSRRYRRSRPRGERVPPRARAAVGRRGRDVPRSGDHPDEARRLRRRGERIARAAHRANERRPRHRLRPRRALTADEKGMRAAMRLARRLLAPTPAFRPGEVRDISS